MRKRNIQACSLDRLGANKQMITNLTKHNMVLGSITPQELGVAGSVELLASRSVSSQPVSSLDWSPDKEGLFCCCAFDQTLRVGIVTKLRTV